MPESEQFFDFRDTRKPVEKIRRKDGGGRKSVNSVITIKKQSDGWRLFTVAFGREQPAGSRLLKRQPWPIDQFSFQTQEEAINAAEALAKYLGTTFKE